MDFDSDEEEWFSWYLDELVDAGFVVRYERSESYQLFDAEVRSFVNAKDKARTKDLVKAHAYTPDFTVYWSPVAVGIFTQSQSADRLLDRIPFIHRDAVDGPRSVIEVKPFFDRHGKTAWAACQIKWTLQKFGDLVQLLKVGSNKKTKGIFSETFTPSKFLRTKAKGQDRKLNHVPRSLAEFVRLNT